MRTDLMNGACRPRSWQKVLIMLAYSVWYTGHWLGSDQHCILRFLNATNKHSKALDNVKPTFDPAWQLFKALGVILAIKVMAGPLSCSPFNIGYQGRLHHVYETLLVTKNCRLFFSGPNGNNAAVHEAYQCFVAQYADFPYFYSNVWTSWKYPSTIIELQSLELKTLWLPASCFSQDTHQQPGNMATRPVSNCNCLSLFPRQVMTVTVTIVSRWT